jgi:hypothetical protein
MGDDGSASFGAKASEWNPTELFRLAAIIKAWTAACRICSTTAKTAIGEPGSTGSIKYQPASKVAGDAGPCAFALQFPVEWWSLAGSNR